MRRPLTLPGSFLQSATYVTIIQSMVREQVPTIGKTWAVFGHELAVQLLRSTLIPSESAGHPTGPRHAYLLLGPAQIGKSTLARAFARALLCTNLDSSGNPCGECRSCHLLARGNHPDLRIVQPLDKEGLVDRAGGMLRREQAAEIVHESALRPIEGRYKVFILQDVHTANDTFANKLLKTLEEPPPQVLFCLTALDRNSVLPTIASRCQIIELRPTPVQVVRDALITGWQARPEEAELLARLANGRIGWAVEQLQNPRGQNQRREGLELLWHMMATDVIERMELAEKLASGRDNRQLFGMLELWTVWWRDLMLAQSGLIDACSNVDHKNEILQQAQKIPAETVRQYLRTLQRVESYLHHTVNTRLALDVLFVRLPSIA